MSSNILPQCSALMVTPRSSGSPPRMRGKVAQHEGSLVVDGLNPTYAGKRISDKVLRMRDARNTFTFPCGVSRRCPPTVTAHSANGCSSLDDHLEAVHPFIRLSPNRRRALVSSVPSDRKAGRVYSLSAYQVSVWC